MLDAKKVALVGRYDRKAGTRCEGKVENRIKIDKNTKSMVVGKYLGQWPLYMGQ